jgi:hypothetical protein
VRRLVRSPGYARARLVTGTLFAALGAVVIVRTAAGGAGWSGFSGYVLGLAMIALAVWRFREYFGFVRK